MAPTKRDTSNAGIYDRMDSLRLEIKQDISVAVNTVATSQGRLEKKFDDLEAGRLTRAEGNINDLRLKIQQQAASLELAHSESNNAEKTLSNKFLALGAIGMVLLSGLMSAIVGFFIHRIGG